MPTAAPGTCPTLSPEPDYCSDNPCKNNGTCYSIIDDYLCVCVNQWTGKNCSEGNKIIWIILIMGYLFSLKAENEQNHSVNCEI